MQDHSVCVQQCSDLNLVQVAVKVIVPLLHVAIQGPRMMEGLSASAHDFQSHSIQQHMGGKRVEAHAGGFGEPGLELAHVSSTYIPLATPHRTVFWKM